MRIQPMRQHGKLRPEQDAFGQALLAASTGEEVFEIVERDDGSVDSLNENTGSLF